MSERVVTWCDLCNVNQDTMKRGFFMGDELNAVQEGWKECDYGIQCAACVSAEEENNRQDEEGGTMHGPSLEAAMAIAKIVQLTQPPPAPKKRGRPKKQKAS